MRGPALLAACLAFAAALAGCSGKGGRETTDDPIDPIDVDVTDDTGAITGIVVDQAITPLAEARVELSGATGNATANTTTDAEGRFAFEGLAPGIYIVEASHPLFRRAQSTAQVEAGIVPDPIRVVLTPRFGQAPYVLPIQHDGYFECSQAGAGLYSSSNCVADQCPVLLDPGTCNGLPTKALDNVTTQEREWHMDVGAGWQGIVFEMTWTASAQGTSDRLGMVVSTYKPLREGTHSFANVISTNPMRFQLDVNETHETAASVDPTMIPADGMQQVSFFVSARPPEDAVCPLLCAPPGLAVEQKFKVFIHQFYYGPVPEDWSFVAGDPMPY